MAAQLQLLDAWQIQSLQTTRRWSADQHPTPPHRTTAHLTPTRPTPRLLQPAAVLADLHRQSLDLKGRILYKLVFAASAGVVCTAVAAFAHECGVLGALLSHLERAPLWPLEDAWLSRLTPPVFLADERAARGAVLAVPLWVFAYSLVKDAADAYRLHLMCKAAEAACRRADVAAVAGSDCQQGSTAF